MCPLRVGVKEELLFVWFYLPATVYLFPPILTLLFAFPLPYLLSKAWQLILFQASEEEHRHTKLQMCGDETNTP